MLPEINLVPEKRKEKKGVYYGFLIGIGFLVVVSSVFIFIYFHSTKELERLSTQYDQYNDQYEVLEKQLTSDKQKDTTDKQATLDYLQSYNVHTSTLIEELVTLLSERSYLSEYKYSLADVTIQVQFETLSEISKYVRRLNKSKYVQDAKINEIEAFSILDTEEQELKKVNYDVIPRYDVELTFQPNKERLLGDTDHE
ncbi:PilN domain-containing protein [Virgibacillus dokdonensis]|uniref:PilN domain-containing protein n=1 Tax=Virgibacillus dokdonensis TaxID=302167 RepID=UPI000989C99D|nr:PilN domain-containing protein [Virgibacillus dokdonensis]